MPLGGGYALVGRESVTARKDPWASLPVSWTRCVSACSSYTEYARTFLGEWGSLGTGQDQCVVHSCVSPIFCESFALDLPIQMARFMALCSHGHKEIQIHPRSNALPVHSLSYEPGGFTTRHQGHEWVTFSGEPGNNCGHCRLPYSVSIPPHYPP